MGFYVYAKTQKEALKKARKEAPKEKLVAEIGKTRHKGLYYVTTRLRKGYI